MKELKKKGHDIKIKGLIIHQVIKEAHTMGCNLKKAKQVISPTKRENLFVANIKEAYYKKSNPTYGIFGEDDKSFQSILSIRKLTFSHFLQKRPNYIRRK